MKKLKLYRNAVRIWVDEEEAIQSALEQFGHGTEIPEEHIEEVTELFEKLEKE